MQVGKIVKLDFSEIKTSDDFYDAISKALGFPSFFGRNINALIDCLTYLREPEAEMSKVHIKESEYLLLELTNFSTTNQHIKDTLLIAIEDVNLRCKEDNQEPSVILSFISCHNTQTSYLGVNF
ncbi:hypothetical protein AwWohl_06060 [Gammaproteobacteria bacterium]|nr:hypothetical protein AwWohl_06060 [Gammaproteobacteria bacterium]